MANTPLRQRAWCNSCMVIIALVCAGTAAGEDKKAARLTAKPNLFKALTNPPCSYCITQHGKGFIKGDDRAVAWLRGKHNGGAIPLRHFLSATRVVNDTYGLFFYDPDGGYVAAYKPDAGYKFYGWRGGVMVVQSSDGTLWSALSGKAFKGPQQGKRLERIPNLVTEWQHWLMLHPESTAYRMYDGKRYPPAPLPQEITKEAKESMGKVDARLQPMANVLGVEVGGKSKAYPLDNAGKLACFTDTMGDEPIAVFWYGPTQTAVAFSARLDGKKLDFFANPAGPATAPFVDRQTQTRWSLAGRGVDGRLRGKQLQWINGLQCRWYAWSTEYPKTDVHKK